MSEVLLSPTMFTESLGQGSLYQHPLQASVRCFCEASRRQPVENHADGPCFEMSCPQLPPDARLSAAAWATDQSVQHALLQAPSDDNPTTFAMLCAFVAAHPHCFPEGLLVVNNVNGLAVEVCGHSSAVDYVSLDEALLLQHQRPAIHVVLFDRPRGGEMPGHFVELRKTPSMPHLRNPCPLVAAHDALEGHAVASGQMSGCGATEASDGLTSAGRFAGSAPESRSAGSAAQHVTERPRKRPRPDHLAAPSEKELAEITRLLQRALGMTTIPAVVRPNYKDAPSEEVWLWVSRLAARADAGVPEGVQQVWEEMPLFSTYIRESALAEVAQDCLQGVSCCQNWTVSPEDACQRPCNLSVCT